MRIPVISICLVLLVQGCGTTVGNGLVKIESAPYSVGSMAIRSVVAVTEFKFCITKIKLIRSDGQTQGGGALEIALGLIDVSDSSKVTPWGEVNVPTGFELDELRVELHKDPERCGGADYSMAYNGARLSKDLEFRFRFNPKVNVNGGETLKLGLTNIAKAIEQAAQQGKFNDEQIGEFLKPETEGSGSN